MGGYRVEVQYHNALGHSNFTHNPGDPGERNTRAAGGDYFYTEGEKET